MTREKVFLAILIVIGVALTWALSVIVIDHFGAGASGSSTDLSALLFGAASVALFVLSIVFAVLAGLGWHALQAATRAEITLKSKLDLMQTELHGRLFSILGHSFGEMSLDPETLELKDRDRILEAVRLCQQGYDLLKKVGGAVEFMGLNNLVFYSCMSGDRSKADLQLTRARLLRDAGQEHDHASLQLTACRAILMYGTDEGEKARARDTLEALGASPDISDKERKEARACLASFQQR